MSIDEKKTAPTDKNVEGRCMRDKLFIAFGISYVVSVMILYFKGIISLTTLIGMSIIPLGLFNFYIEVMSAL